MVVRKDQRTTSSRDEMRGGKGTILLTDIITKDDMMGAGRLFTTITVNPGCSIGEHKHEGEAEIFYIVSGELDAFDNDQAVKLGEGDVLYTGDGSSHSIENKSDKPCVLVALILNNING